MRTIAERDAYHREIDDEWKQTRTPLSVAFGVFWAAGMYLSGLLVLWVAGELTARDVWMLAVFLVPGGIVTTAAVRRWGWDRYSLQQRRLMDRLYDGDPEIAAPPPPAHEYPFRHVCAWVLSPRAFLGGVLYLGPSGFLFVPNVGHAPELREPVRMGPIGTIVVSRVSVHVPRSPRWLLGSRPTDLLLIQWEGGGALLTSPEPAETERRMLAKLRAWKFDPPSPAS